jgi:HEAT repeat protein
LGILKDVRALESIRLIREQAKGKLRCDAVYKPGKHDGIYKTGKLIDLRGLKPMWLKREPSKRVKNDLLFWCQWALVRLSDESALHPLIAYLPSDNFRLRAAQALGDFGNRVAVEPLIEAWKLGVIKTPARIYRVRRFIVDALKKLDASRAIVAFNDIALGADDPEIRKAAQTALDQLQTIKPK